jgi:hypothetical protein
MHRPMRKMSIHLTVKHLGRIARLDSLLVVAALLLAIFVASCGHSENSEEPRGRRTAVNTAASQSISPQRA